MWWTGFLIFHALEALCQQTGSEYLSNESGAESKGYLKLSDVGIPFEDSAERYLKNKSADSLATYLYLRNKDDLPKEVNCFKCLEPFLVDKINSLDSCSCLPCVQRFSNDDIHVSQELMIYFMSLDCTKYGNHNLNESGIAKRLRPTTDHVLRTPKTKKTGNELKKSRELLSDNLLPMRDHRKYTGSTSRDTLKSYNYPEYRDYLRHRKGRKNSKTNRNEKQNRYEEMKKERDKSEEFPSSEKFRTLKNQPQNNCHLGRCRKSKESLQIDEKMENSEGNQEDKSKDGKDKLKKIFGQLMKMMHESKKKNLENAFITHDTHTNDTESRRQNSKDVSKIWNSPEQRRNGLDIYMNKYKRPSYRLHPSFNNRKTKTKTKIPLVGKGRDQTASRRYPPARHALGSRRESNELASDLYKFYSSATPKGRELYRNIKKEIEGKYKKTDQKYLPPGKRKNLITLSKEDKKKINREKNDRNPLKLILEDAEIAESSASNIAANNLDSSLRNVKMKNDEGIKITTVKGGIKQKKKSKALLHHINEGNIGKPSTTETGVIQTGHQNEEYVAAPTTTTEMAAWNQKETINKLTEENGMSFKNYILNTNLTPTIENTDSKSDINKLKEDGVEYEGEFSLESTTINSPIKLLRSELKTILKSLNMEKNSEKDDEEKMVMTPSHMKSVETEITTEMQTNHDTVQSEDSPLFRSLSHMVQDNVAVGKLENGKNKKKKLLKRSTRSLASITEPTEHVTQKYKDSQNEGSRGENEKNEKETPHDKEISYGNGTVHVNVVEHGKTENKSKNSKSHKRSKHDESRASEGRKKPKTSRKNSAEKNGENEENDSFSTIIHVKGNHKTPNQSIQINVKLHGEKDVDHLLHLLNPMLEQSEQTKNLDHVNSLQEKKGKNSDREVHSHETAIDDDYYIDSELEDESKEHEYLSRTSRDQRLVDYEEMPEHEAQIPLTRKSQNVLENSKYTSRGMLIAKSEDPEKSSEYRPKIPNDVTSENSKCLEEARIHTEEMHHPVLSAFRSSGEESTRYAVMHGESAVPSMYLTRPKIRRGNGKPSE